MSEEWLGRVRAVERMSSTRSGNPVFRVTIACSDGRERPVFTEPDAQVAGMIENREYRESDCIFTLRDYLLVGAEVV